MATQTSTANQNAQPLTDSIETLGNFFPYSSDLPIKEIEGTRTLPVCYKQTAKMKTSGINARDNVFIRVPTAHITEETVINNISLIAPYIVQYLRATENTYLAEQHKAGIIRVHTELLSLPRVLDILEARGQGGSLDTETITTWFAANVLAPLREQLYLILATTPEEATPEQVAQLDAAVAGYLASFVSLASGKTTMPAPQREKLAKVLERTGATASELGCRFLARFDKMAQKELEALEALGAELSL